MDTSSTVSLPEFWGKSCDWYDVPCHASSMIEWAQKFFVWLPCKIFETLCSGLAALVNAIPVPSFVSTASSSMGSIPANVAFFAAPLQIGPGMAMILSAYVLRFVIRRLPIVG